MAAQLVEIKNSPAAKATGTDPAHTLS